MDPEGTLPKPATLIIIRDLRLTQKRTLGPNSETCPSWNSPVVAFVVTDVYLM